MVGFFLAELFEVVFAAVGKGRNIAATLRGPQLLLAQGVGLHRESNELDNGVRLRSWTEQRARGAGS